MAGYEAQSTRVFAARQRKERDAREAESDGEEIRGKLIDAAHLVGIEFPAEASANTLILLLQVAIDWVTELNAIRSDIAERKRDVNARDDKAKKAKEAEQVWNGGWEIAPAAGWQETIQSQTLKVSVKF